MQGHFSDMKNVVHGRGSMNCTINNNQPRKTCVADVLFLCGSWASWLCHLCC